MEVSSQARVHHSAQDDRLAGDTKVRAYQDARGSLDHAFDGQDQRRWLDPITPSGLSPGVLEEGADRGPGEKFLRQPDADRIDQLTEPSDGFPKSQTEAGQVDQRHQEQSQEDDQGDDVQLVRDDLIDGLVSRFGDGRFGFGLRLGSKQAWIDRFGLGWWMFAGPGFNFVPNVLDAFDQDQSAAEGND